MRGATWVDVVADRESKKKPTIEKQIKQVVRVGKVIRKHEIIQRKYGTSKKR